ncbi:hypothetical protein [uncultured Flavobacterium sp.]|uniref:hypothetical protein n=1 Tax=uncultured Flavobacterium sp. TaxID=165435 RepID=UPI0030C8A329
MGWGWLNKIVVKIAAEVHKTKIDEFEKRLLEIEQKQQVILKSIENNQKAINKLDNRIYKANIESATAVGAINAVISRANGNNLLTQRENDNA